MATGGKKPGIRDIGDFVQVFDKICQTLAKYKDKFYKFTKDAARKIRLRLHGKQIAVLGPVAAGKTTLLHVLKDPSVVIDPMTYEKTTDAVNFADRLFVEWKLPLDDVGKEAEVIRLKVRKPKDVGGEAAQRDTQTGWLDVCKESDFLFYLFDASTYSEDGTLARIREDFNWIANNAQAFAPGFKIVIFANKIDKIIGDVDLHAAFEQQLPKIENTMRDALGSYSKHLVAAAPCCLLSCKDRTNAISLALKHLAELL